jgi:hypothetical protein
MTSIRKTLKKVKTMYNDLRNVSDEKLIEGYKKAMKDYEEKKEDKIKVVANVIKTEIDRRGLKVE